MHLLREIRNKTMRRRLATLLALGLLVILPGIAHAADGDDLLSRYRLASGDVLSIYVLGEDDLKREKVRLTDAGTIQYPVLGEIHVKGLTTGELEQKITFGLRKADYLKKPKVTVSIDEYRPFFINGEVGRPGGYPYVPGLTVLKAVSLAGGFKDRASKTNMFVVRDGTPNEQRKKVALDTAIYPGDILTIEESFF